MLLDFVGIFTVCSIILVQFQYQVLLYLYNGGGGRIHNNSNSVNIGLWASFLGMTLIFTELLMFYHEDHDLP